MTEILLEPDINLVHVLSGSNNHITLVISLDLSSINYLYKTSKAHPTNVYIKWVVTPNK